ncbi:MAG: bifunctional nuclease family protein, partial [Caldilineaceae bacterium]|nr:bifunctional nuclease family protein [Caldilineaceae bacterium]
MEHVADSELVLATVGGDKQAFGTLADRHSERAWRAATRMVGNDDIARELVQEALLQAYLGIAALREPAYFGAWLTGIVHNVCRTYLRAQQRFGNTVDLSDETMPFADEALDPFTQLEAQERRELVQRAITALSPKNQMATWLFYMEEMSIGEVAQMLAVSSNAIKGRLHQARKQLYTELAPTLAPPRLRRATTPSTTQERNRPMVTISTVKVLRTMPGSNHILFLFDTDHQRYLKVWIGAHEGEQIRLQLETVATARPMTYRYFADFLQAMEIQLEAVTVSHLHEMTFYAVSRFRNGETVKELDGRPSDAIGLALHTGSSIFVDDELMASHSEPLPDGREVDDWLVDEIEHMRQEQLATAGLHLELLKENSEAFTAYARIALIGATGLAHFLHHNYVGTEHLLWGLVNDNSGLAAQILSGVGVTPFTLNQVAIARLGAMPQAVEVEKLERTSDP